MGSRSEVGEGPVTSAPANGDERELVRAFTDLHRQHRFVPAARPVAPMRVRHRPASDVIDARTVKAHAAAAPAAEPNGGGGPGGSSTRMAEPQVAQPEVADPKSPGPQRSSAALSMRLRTGHLHPAPTRCHIVRPPGNHAPPPRRAHSAPA